MRQAAEKMRAGGAEYLAGWRPVILARRLQGSYSERRHAKSVTKAFQHHNGAGLASPCLTALRTRLAPFKTAFRAGPYGGEAATLHKTRERAPNSALTWDRYRASAEIGSS